MKAAIVLALLAALATTSSEALAHAMLAHAEPAVGSVVKAAPPEVRLAFSERVERDLSAIEVRDASGRRVDTGALRSEGDGTVLIVPLPSGLVPGHYKVIWRILSVDTHVTRGDFSFTVEP
jgi:methionine-rich copper-binding protein CopC